MRTKAEWEKIIASLESPDILCEIGKFLVNNEDGEENAVLAADAFRKAIDAGSTAALYGLAMCYRWGDGGVYAEPKEALKYFRLSAEAGDERARKMVDMFDSPTGESLLLMSAISGAGGQGAKWYKAKAGVDRYLELADQGDAEAQYELALQLENPKRYGPFRYDIAQAVYWYEKAADGQVVDAMFNLAMIYLKGRPGLEPDIDKATLWFQRCADAGDAEAEKIVLKLRNHEPL